MKEKVFMLEHQNLALAKQYFCSQQENDTLKQDNSSYTSQIQDLESYCMSYQSLLQMIYSRVNSIVSDFSRSVVMNVAHSSYLGPIPCRTSNESLTRCAREGCTF